MQNVNQLQDNVAYFDMFVIEELEVRLEMEQCCDNCGYECGYAGSNCQWVCSGCRECTLH